MDTLFSGHQQHPQANYPANEGMFCLVSIIHCLSLVLTSDLVLWWGNPTNKPRLKFISEVDTLT